MTDRKITPLPDGCPKSYVDTEKLAREALAPAIAKLAADFKEVPGVSPPEPQDQALERMPPSEAISLPDRPGQVLKGLVERQVAEILSTREAFIFEPFMRSKKVSDEIRRLQTVPEWGKWTRYFEVWGCIACQSRDPKDPACGLCRLCYCRIRERLRTIIDSRKGGREGDTGEYQPPIRDLQDVARRALLDLPQDAAPTAEEPRRTYRTLKQVAEAAGVDPKTLYVWLRSGEIQPPSSGPWTDWDIEYLKLFKARNSSKHGSKASRARWDRRLGLATPTAQKASAPRTTRPSVVDAVNVTGEALSLQQAAPSTRALAISTPAPTKRGCLTQTEAAAEAGISGATLRDWIVSGQVPQPATKSRPGRWLWSEEEIAGLKAFASSRRGDSR